MSSFPFATEESKGRVHKVSNTDVLIEVTLSEKIKGTTVHYIAAAPAEVRASYTGSALPFPSPAMALDGTPNKGEAHVADGRTFSMKIKMPNSYYAALGTVLVPPTVYVSYLRVNGKEHTFGIKVGESIPFRSLTYPNGRTSSIFYDNMSPKIPIRSQEQVLYDSCYPSTMHTPENFWNMKPPL